MPNFWEFPTVFDGLGPNPGDLPRALYPVSGESRPQQSTGGKVWAFLGDGEMDEPESLGSITLASRESGQPDFRSELNLQRLDDRFAATEKSFRNSRRSSARGMERYQVHLGLGLDSLIRADRDGLLVRRLGK